MCGIFGYIAKKPPTLQTISDCQNIQFHRGPDRQGEFKSRLESWHIGLFHQRLSILDLSEAGNQPAVNNSHDKAMVFNGEIYNFKEIEKKTISL